MRSPLEGGIRPPRLRARTAGLNRFTFSGRLAGRKLRPGSYRFVVTAKDGAANTSSPVRRLFRIIR